MKVWQMLVYLGWRRPPKGAPAVTVDSDAEEIARAHERLETLKAKAEVWHLAPPQFRRYPQ